MPQQAIKVKASMHNEKLETLWDRYCCQLLAFIRSRISDEAEAEDLLQKVFIRVHRNLCCLPAPTKMDSWIYQIARNLIVDHYRRRKESVEIPESLPAEADFPEDDPETELSLSIKDMIAELPLHYRQALILTEYEGLSQKPLAENLGISESGVKSRVQRAWDKLRDMFLAC